MNPDTAIQFGQLILAAYNVPPTDQTNLTGQQIDPKFDPFQADYKVVTSIYGNDLATDMNPQRGNTIVSFGFILQSKDGGVVVAIRGTEGIWEWLHDAQFLYVNCPFLSNGGNTEDGFTAIYQSLKTDTGANADSVVEFIKRNQFPQAITSMTICGHSLGAALATLLAVDLAANTNTQFITAYTYASPRVGDPSFAASYNRLVPSTFRLDNRLDIVPKLPIPPMYEHVLGLVDLNPVESIIPPKFLVNDTLPCEHSLTTYLYLISQLPGASQAQALDPQCSPVPTAPLTSLF